MKRKANNKTPSHMNVEKATLVRASPSTMHSHLTDSVPWMCGCVTHFVTATKFNNVGELFSD